MLRLAFLATLLSPLAACEALKTAEPPTGTAKSGLIAGNLTSTAERRSLGLVSLDNGCSGVMLTERWILTAGHCLGNRPYGFTVTSAHRTARIDLVYAFGGELDSKGMASRRGFDLALVRTAAPLTAEPFTQRGIYAGSVSAGTVATFYGQGISTYFRPGPPPVAQSGGGTWRKVNLTIQQVVGNIGHRAERPGWPDFLVAPANSAGQICAPGDSGGPVFFTKGNASHLLGIQIEGSYECPNQASVSAAQCSSTITRINSCRAEMIPRETTLDIINSTWDPRAATAVMDVGAELFHHLFVDPARETLVDMNVRHWAVAARAANEMCYNRGFVSGHMSGHQLVGKGKYQLVCSSRGAVWRDANNAEILRSGFPFSNVDSAHWAQARRAANNICTTEGKGFVGGFFNGHQFVNPRFGFERAGLVCVGAPAAFFDATPREIAATGWPIRDLNQVGWAHADRAAVGFCHSKRFATGFMTGHQVPGKYGVVCQL